MIAPVIIVLFSNFAVIRPGDHVADSNEAVVFSQNSRKSYSKSRNCKGVLHYTASF